MAATRRGRPLGSGRVNLAKVEATTEEDIRRYMIEDGLDPDTAPGPHRVVLPPAEVRKRSGLSQDAFAKAIGVPAGTVRNWEQGRTLPDPAARSLLALVTDDPERVFKVLASVRPAEATVEGAVSQI
jgi:putative transcriptional regulator